MKKKIIGIFVCMLLISAVLPVTGNVIIDKNPYTQVNGNTLYVGGSGPGNYSTIQDAINDANLGDTVFVYDDSSPYVENLIIKKSIILKGEDKNTTVIDGNNNEEGQGDVIHIKANGVTVQGFTIQNCSGYGGGNFCGIEIRSNNNLIKDNIINNNCFGIKIGYGSESFPKVYVYNNIIEDNHIFNNNEGIFLSYAFNSEIKRNIISNNKWQGIYITRYSNKNFVSNNKIEFNEQAGVDIIGNDNTIKRNTIINNKWGVDTEYSYGNEIIENNIYNFEIAPSEKYSLLYYLFKGANVWDGNYWGEPLQQPIKIPVKCYFGFFLGYLGLIFGDEPLFIMLYLYDSNPAQEPYDI